MTSNPPTDPGQNPGLTFAEVAADLDRVLARIDRTWSEDADRYEADTHYTLEDVEKMIQALRDRIGDQQ
ncbi:hypothetical protein [Actinomadura macrotermitis]|uniref:Uncharacterized protein n=1 Tax=Actinomadura macrotermitis TaxID=2585200 RepID=A0A7K0C8U7_9ACTN|nr:hypothetical protein [Actinomadura macrotermitis]MQY09877.1 hypothetical protein [Actinomadura macrotermitis]